MHKVLIVADGIGKYNHLRKLIRFDPASCTVSRCSSMSEAAETIRNEGADIMVAEVGSAYSEMSMDREPVFMPTKGNAKQDLGYVKQYIRNHYNEKIELTNLAAIVHLTPNYLCTLFKKEEKMTVRTYIEKVRLERAVFLLISTDKSIAAISSEIGYRQPSYFCRVFREKLHETPSEYRKNTRPKRNGERNAGR